MRQFSWRITDELGLHARPAGMLAKKAFELSSSVVIQYGTRMADAKQVVSLIMLEAEKDSSLMFTVEGKNEAEDAETLELFIREKL